MALKITLMTWDKFIEVVLYPFKIMYGILNVLDTVELAPGFTIIDIVIFGIIAVIITSFILIQTKGR